MSFDAVGGSLVMDDLRRRRISRRAAVTTRPTRETRWVGGRWWAVEQWDGGSLVQSRTQTAAKGGRKGRRAGTRHRSGASALQQRAAATAREILGDASLTLAGPRPSHVHPLHWTAHRVS